MGSSFPSAQPSPPLPRSPEHGPFCPCTDAELYVARGVPKAIDYVRSFLLDVPGVGCFAAEAFLEPGAAGEFIKFSSNSGAWHELRPLSGEGLGGQGLWVGWCRREEGTFSS
jgi:hypothetical protein